MRRSSPAPADARRGRLPAARESSRGLAKSDDPRGRRQATRRMGARSARNDAHSSADRSAASVAAAASAVRPATSPFLYRITAWETGGDGGNAGSAAGADSSGRGAGADGSGTAEATGGATAERRAQARAPRLQGWRRPIGPWRPCRSGRPRLRARGTLGGSAPRARRRFNVGRAAAPAPAPTTSRCTGARSASLKRPSEAAAAGDALEASTQPREAPGKRRRQRPEAGQIARLSWVQSS